MSQRFLVKGSWRKKVAILLVLTACIFTGITYYTHSHVSQRIADSSGISCNEISINLLSGCIDLHDLEIVQDLKDAEQLTLRSTKAHIHGLSYWKYLRQNKVAVKNLVFENLDIEVSPYLDENPTIPQEKTAESSPPSEIFIKSFQILDGRLNVKDNQFNKIEIDSFSTEVSAVQYFPERDSAQVEWGISEFWSNNLRINIKDKHYLLASDEIKLTTNKELSILNMEWQPKRNKENFTKSLSCRKPRLDIKLQSLNIYPFSVEEILFENRFRVSNIVIGNGDLEVFSDKTKEACTDHKMYFYEKLAETDLQIHVDSITIKKSKITFEELRHDDNSGELTWNDVYASIYDLSNMPETQKSNTYVNIQANFVEESKLKVNFTFPNFSSVKNYKYDGTLDHIELTKLNRFLNFSNRLRIKTGELNQLTFKGEGNSKSSSGTMELLYKDLGVALLKKDGSRRKFLSKLSNVLINNRNNPDAKNELRIGRMYSERNTEKSFISNWWMTLQSGMKSTILPNFLLPDELEVEK